MVLTRGGKSSNRSSRAPKTPTPAVSTQPKWRSDRIAAGTAKRTFKRVKTFVHLPSSSCNSGHHSDPEPTEQSSPVQQPPAPSPAPTSDAGASSPTSPPLPSGPPTEPIPGEWLPHPTSKQEFRAFSSKVISVCDELDVQFFASEKFGFYDKLIKDNCLGSLTLGNVVYPQLVRLLYAHLELKSTSDGVSVESIVKGVKIALDRSVLSQLFGLKFINTAPSNLTGNLPKNPICLNMLALNNWNPTHGFAKPHHIIFYTPSLDSYIMSLSGYFIPKITLERLPMK
uniref:Uncharacterized protein n=1 Tax=Opuntia streptacantha TaxID=393608 RepID=A0A7C9A3Y1_OPUST